MKQTSDRFGCKVDICSKQTSLADRHYQLQDKTYFGLFPYSTKYQKLKQLILVYLLSIDDNDGDFMKAMLIIVVSP